MILLITNTETRQRETITDVIRIEEAPTLKQHTVKHNNIRIYAMRKEELKYEGQIDTNESTVEILPEG